MRARSRSRSRCLRRTLLRRPNGRRSFSSAAWCTKSRNARWRANTRTCARTSPARRLRSTPRSACCCSRRGSPPTTSATTNSARDHDQASAMPCGGSPGKRAQGVRGRRRPEGRGGEGRRRILRLSGDLPAPGGAALRGPVRRLGAHLPHASLAVGCAHRRSARHRRGPFAALSGHGRRRFALSRRRRQRARHGRAFQWSGSIHSGEACRAGAPREPRGGRGAVPPRRPGRGFLRARVGPRRVSHRPRRAHRAGRLHAEEGRSVRLGGAARRLPGAHRERALPGGVGAAAHQRQGGAARARGRSRGGIDSHAAAGGADRAVPCIIGNEIMKLKTGLILLAALAAGTAAAAEPVKLVVGYQPYDTISYSAVVIRALELWKKHLPPGSEVEFQNALQGSIIVNQMLANKQQIGYLGDMPAVVATTKRSVAPIDLVANTGLSPGQRCNVIMVRADAPKFSSPQEAVRWLDGKTLATPQGSCAHRFLGLVIETTKIKPAAILNQSIEVIATNLRAGKIDAAVLWEPSVSRIGDIVGEGFARIAATGHTFGISDAGAIPMREDFLKEHPDIVEAWLRTELQAQQYVIDPKNWTNVAEFVKDQTQGIRVPMA